jgi:hypothetical protein
MLNVTPIVKKKECHEAEKSRVFSEMVSGEAQMVSVMKNGTGIFLPKGEFHMS